MTGCTSTLIIISILPIGTLVTTSTTNDEIDRNVRFQALNVSLREGFVDEQMKLVCYTDHQIFDRFHRFREKNKYSKSKALTLKELRSLQIGDFVTHVDYGIGRFAGLDRVQIGDSEQEAIQIGRAHV